MAMIKHVNLSNFKFDIDFEDQCIRWTTFDAVSKIYYISYIDIYDFKKLFIHYKLKQNPKKLLKFVSKFIYESAIYPVDKSLPNFKEAKCMHEGPASYFGFTVCTIYEMKNAILDYEMETELEAEINKEQCSHNVYHFVDHSGLKS